MLSKIEIGVFLRNILWRSLKLPIVYLMIGIVLIALAYIDDVFPITEWKHLFDLTDKVGSIFITIAAVTFVYQFIVLTCRWYEKKLAQQKQIAVIILSSLRRGLRIIFILALINMIITVIGPKKFYLVVANSMINCIIIGFIGWIAIQILYTVEAVLYQHMIKLAKSDHLRIKALYTKMHIIRNTATVVIVILTIAAILMSFSSVRNIGISLLASAGFLTAIVGLAAQKTLFSLFTGLQLALSHQLKIGDVVLIENASGIVEEITFSHVTLKISDGRRLIVPIHFFVDKPFENWSKDGENFISSFQLYVDYMIPIAPIREELLKILESSPLWDGKIQKLQVSNLAEHVVELRIQVSAKNVDHLSDLQAEVREKILSFIREHYSVHLAKFRFTELREKSSDLLNLQNAR